MSRHAVGLRLLIALLLAVALRAGLAPEALEAAGRRKAEGYSGLAFRDIAGGQVVVSWIYPGPLDGDGFVAHRADLARPDLVVALNGDPPRSARSAQERIRTMAPGDTLRLDVRTSRRRGGAIADTLDHEEGVRRIDVVLEDRATWAGTIGSKPARETPLPRLDEPRLVDPRDPANALGAAVAALQLGAAVDTLAGVFAQWQEDFPDAHSLSHVRAAFADPFRLPEIARSVTAPAAGAPEDPMGTALQLMRHALDASRGSDRAARSGRGATGRPPAADRFRRANRGDVPLHWWIAEKRFEESLREATRRAAGALGDAAADTTLPRKVLALLRVPHETFYLQGDVTRDHAEVMRRSRDVDFAQLADALEALAPLAALSADGLTDWSAPPEHAAAIPPPLAGAVEGAIRSAHFVAGAGWIVIGSDANNRYDIARIAGILDPGGDDEYRSSAITPGARAIVDFAGNDRYLGGAEGGPAAALFGVTLVDDRAGDDSYEGGLLATGAASFGAALLLDRAGNDRYAGALWSIGAAMYGAGIVMDLGPGGDTYAGDFLCQGVGGPRGLGAIVDEAGNDLYRANGPTPSAYGTPGVYQAFSQGIGFGFRLYAAGGAGILCDLAGDDRYEAGEFAQGSTRSTRSTRAVTTSR